MRKSLGSFKEYLSIYQFILVQEIRNKPADRSGLFLTGKLAVIKDVQKLITTAAGSQKSNAQIAVKVKNFLDETKRGLRTPLNKDSSYIEGKVSMVLLLLEKIDELQLIPPVPQSPRRESSTNTSSVIGRLRQKLHLTQQELAVLSGLHPWTISQAERGRMSLQTATKIASVFNVSIEEISKGGMQPLHPTKFSNGITKLRAKQGISQNELAKKCGLSIPTLIMAEKGKATEKTMRKISDFFGVPIAEFSQGIKMRTFQPKPPKVPRPRSLSIIARLRAERHMTQRKLAELCGLSSLVIHFAENGKATIRTLTRIARALDVPVETVSEGIVNRNPFTKGSTIVKLREKRNMSKSKLAKQCGVTVKTITSAERGRARTQTLVKIAEGLDVPFEVIAKGMTTSRRRVNVRQ